MDNMNQPTYALKDSFYGNIIDLIVKRKSKKSDGSIKDS